MFTIAFLEFLRLSILECVFYYLYNFSVKTRIAKEGVYCMYVHSEAIIVSLEDTHSLMIPGAATRATIHAAGSSD